VVLEYARADAAGGVAGIFRLGESRSDTFAFVPRGLDIAKTYNVWLDNQGRSVPIAGLSLCTTGIPVHLPGKMTSELLVINEQG
jgi:hypothetical protein